MNKFRIVAHFSHLEDLMSPELSCNICGGKDYKVLFAAHVAQVNQIVKCKTCGLMYANPRKPGELESIELLDPDWFTSHLDLSWIRQRIEKESLHVRDYRDARAFLEACFPQKGTLIEIGSGFGFLCDFFRKTGWTVTGIDPCRGSCRYAESELHLNVIPLPLEKTNIPPHSADVVLMMHVIEHLEDPKEALRHIYKILKPGGILVLETPRYDTWMFKWLGRRERSISSDDHVFFFTSATLKELARQCGFEIMRLDYVGRSLTFDRMLYNLAIVLKSKVLAEAFTHLSRFLRLEKFWIHLNLRDMQRIYLKRR